MIVQIPISHTRITWNPREVNSKHKEARLGKARPGNKEPMKWKVIWKNKKKTGRRTTTKSKRLVDKNTKKKKIKGEHPQQTNNTQPPTSSELYTSILWPSIKPNHLASQSRPREKARDIDLFLMLFSLYWNISYWFLGAFSLREMEMMCYQLSNSSYQDSLKVLEADIQHANALWVKFMFFFRLLFWWWDGLFLFIFISSWDFKNHLFCYDQQEHRLFCY